MKIGVKFGDYEGFELVEEILDKVDFLEVYTHSDIDYSFVKKLGLPIVLHSEHYATAQTNLSNFSRINKNKRCLENSLYWADELKAKTVIVHPGLIEDENCSLNQTIKFLGNYEDDRIAIESMPDQKFFGGYFSSMKDLLNKTNKKFCLDLSHSSQMAFKTCKDILSYLSLFLTLKPAHFHISDTRLDSLLDEHLSLGEGNLPLGKIREILPENAWVTLETPKCNLKKDIEFLRTAGARI